MTAHICNLQRQAIAFWYVINDVCLSVTLEAGQTRQITLDYILPQTTHQLRDRTLRRTDGDWRLLPQWEGAPSTPPVIPAPSETLAKTGDIVSTLAAGRNGWVLANGTYIGDANSAANGRADADCEALFKLLWANLAFTVNGGRGSSASADWLAHKRLLLPDLRGRILMGADPTRSVLDSTAWPTTTPSVGVTGGNAKVTLIQANIPELAFNLSAAQLSLDNGNGPINEPGSVVFSQDNVATSTDNPFDASVGTGIPTPVSLIPPALLVNWLIKL